MVKISAWMELINGRIECTSTSRQLEVTKSCFHVKCPCVSAVEQPFKIQMYEI